MDEANSVNSVLQYRIVDQIPPYPKEGLFLVQTYTGVFQLAKQSLKKQDSPQYNLTVEVSDKGQYPIRCQEWKYMFSL